MPSLRQLLHQVADLRCQTLVPGQDRGGERADTWNRWSSVTSSREGEIEEVPLQAGSGHGIGAVSKEQLEILILRAKNLLGTKGSFSDEALGCGIKEVERADQRLFKANLIARPVRCQRATNFAVDVPHLLEDRHLSPLHSIHIMWAHGDTIREISSMTCCLVAGSSTPRDRLFWLGRMFTIESNSMKSAVPYFPG